ncbi:MAG: hypothetical protein JO126_03010 [Alphaproteobacteria bacterium]|nr:hypothetical protein [Alphaproteobacteria bacterium]MBV8548410.1 hypothetical protein [Alphaproteobacteria bacterium]
MKLTVPKMLVAKDGHDAIMRYGVVPVTALCTLGILYGLAAMTLAKPLAAVAHAAGQVAAAGHTLLLTVPLPILILTVLFVLACGYAGGRIASRLSRPKTSISEDQPVR